VIWSLVLKSVVRVDGSLIVVAQIFSNLIKAFLSASQEI